MKGLALAVNLLALLFTGLAVYGLVFGGPSVFECSVMAFLCQIRAEQMSRRSE